MVTRAIVRWIWLAGAVLAIAHPAHAESPRLAQARHAVDTVKYDAAQRLLVEALQDGGNSPAALGEIYQLSARTAVVLGHPELAEQFYRRWLAIDPRAALPTDTAPKLRTPFEAAQAYLAGHGGLAARAARTADGVDVTVTSDPLQMARAAIALDGAATAAPLGSGSVAHLAASTTRAAVLDEYGNHVLELDVPPPVPGAPGPTAPAAPAAPGRLDAPKPAVSPRSWPRRWTTWAIPTAACGIVSVSFLGVALQAQITANQIAAESGAHRKADVDDELAHARTYTWVSAITAAATVGFAIPMAVYFLQQREEPRATIVPIAGRGTAGLAITGQF
jgi:hypothetical protein